MRSTAHKEDTNSQTDQRNRSKDNIEYVAHMAVNHTEVDQTVQHPAKLAETAKNRITFTTCVEVQVDLPLLIQNTVGLA